MHKSSFSPLVALRLARLILQAEDRPFPLKSSNFLHGQLQGGHQVMPGTWAALLAVYVRPRTALLNKKKKMKKVNINAVQKDKTIAKYSRIKEKKL